MQLWRVCVCLSARAGQAQAQVQAQARHLTTTQQFLKKSKRGGGGGRGSPHLQPSLLQQLVQADTHYIEKQKRETLQIFPNVKSTLKNMFHNLSTNLSEQYRCEEKTSAMGRVSHQLVFHCSLTLTWPSHTTFHGYAFSKRNAEATAALKAIEMLYKDNHLTPDGYPVTASTQLQQECLRAWNPPPRITIPAAALQEGDTLLLRFEQEVRPMMERVRAGVPPPRPGVGVGEEEEEGEGLLEGLEEEEERETLQRYLNQQKNQEEEEEEEEEVLHSLLTGKRLDREEEEAKYRNRLLFLLHKRQTDRQADRQTDRQPNLPMLKYRGEVLRSLEDKQVLVIAGDTGCGKSTQVPQMILDQWAAAGRGAECNVVVTQPRRISAIALARRVARERGEALGESVGFRVRLEQQLLHGCGGVLFCTAGLLLQALQGNPGLQGVSHVVLDEVHERSVHTDVLLLLLRRLLRQRPELKVVLMSASLSTQQLQQYFRQQGVAVLRVPGTLYPLTRHFLPQALTALGMQQQQKQQQHPAQHGVDVAQVVEVIGRIEATRPPGAVLCFLPGWQEIMAVQQRLQRQQELWRRLCVLPLHSRLATQEQQRIFEPAPPGQRKVVLATNLAETSITVADVVFVVDTGLHREHRYNSKTELSVLGSHWISRANSQQRAGRAGRVQAGEVFHLYTEEVFRDMAEFPVPEIMRVSLEHVILQCKAHCGNESVWSFLSECLSVPSRRLVAAALATLQRLGMLVQGHHTSAGPPQGHHGTMEHLTPLGLRVTHFTTPPHFSKALVMASVFRCLEPVLSISASLTGGQGIFHSSVDLRPKTREVKAQVDPTSDLLALHSLLRGCRACENYGEKLDFCNDKNLSFHAVKFVEGIRQVYGNHLYEAELLDGENIYSEFSRWNANSSNAQLILGVLLRGSSTLLLYQKGSYSKGILTPNSLAIKSEKGQFIDTSSDSVLHQPPRPPHNTLPPHLLCLHMSRDAASRRTVARDLSLLKPLTVALFSGDTLEGEEGGEAGDQGGAWLRVDGKEKRTFRVTERTARLLLHLRSAMDQVTQYVIETRNIHVSPPEVDLFCEELVSYVSELLKTQEEEEEEEEEEEGRKGRAGIMIDKEEMDNNGGKVDVPLLLREMRSKKKG